VKLKELFNNLGKPGDISESVGLFYTIMHLWRIFYLEDLIDSSPEALATANYLVKAGVLQSLMRIASRGFDCTFFSKEYNRLVPYRAIESIFAATQSSNKEKDWYIDVFLDESLNTFDTLYRMMCGEITSIEAMLACQLVGNASCTVNGTRWIIEHPKIMGKMSTFLWTMFNLAYTTHMQYEERQVYFMTQQAYTKLQFVEPNEAYDVHRFSTDDVHMVHLLCSLCNVCAAHPDDEPMERIEPGLLSCVHFGVFDHAGTVLYGSILNDISYKERMLEKFLSFFSWTTFQIASQKALIDQLKSRPSHREDQPLFFDRNRDSKSNSVLAILNTHAIHIDYDKGSNFVTLAMVFLLKEDEDIAMEVIRWIGDTLIDLSHSTFHVPMPNITDKPTSVKRIVLETMLKFGGSTFYNEAGGTVHPSGWVTCSHVTMNLWMS